jgi:urease accessory protein UreH
LLRLAFARRGDATILRRCRYTLPLQVLAPFTLDDGTSYLLLLNPTGGILGGDHLRTDVTLEDGARVCLSTPSATRLYRSSGAFAEMQTLLRIGRNATLEYLPDHIIPHSGSSLRQSLRIEMDEGSRGVFFESFSAGRIALKETWQFRDYDSRTDIFLRGQPVFANRTLVRGGSSSPLGSRQTPAPVSLGSLFGGSEPQLRHNPGTEFGALAPEVNNFDSKVLNGTATSVRSPLPHVVIPSVAGHPMRVGVQSEAARARGLSSAESRQISSHPASALGRMADYTYSGSLLLIADQFENWPALVADLRAELVAASGIFGAASLLARSGCSVRYLAHSAIEFHAATERLWTLARQRLLGLPPLALRKY